MSSLLIRITKYYLLKFIQLPMTLWINFQWANLRHREMKHLLNLDDYLLEDMGLMKVGNRIEAIDPSRIEGGRDLTEDNTTKIFSKKRAHQSN